MRTMEMKDMNKEEIDNINNISKEEQQAEQETKYTYDYVDASALKGPGTKFLIHVDVVDNVVRVVDADEVVPKTEDGCDGRIPDRVLGRLFKETGESVVLDYVVRKVGGRDVGMFVDDEGLLKDSPCFSGVYVETDGTPMPAIAGSMLMFSAEQTGDGDLIAFNRMEALTLLQNMTIGMLTYADGSEHVTVVLE